ncbi:Tom37 metaxin N-terminal-like domain-containing protein [Sulfitobacter porphyrae]|uniref:Tom37 metaxin N-terminal-like domain-containing protein n=1 Tax=Sulfitobacter porphyrae TaxID=1246864 RepID=A0ABW2B6D4_9RHOB
MITLITFAPSFGQIAASPFCVKAIWLLNMSGEDWQREDSTDPRNMPKQKLPAIRVDGQVIADSDNIRAFLESRGADFDGGLSEMEKAARAPSSAWPRSISIFTTCWPAGATMTSGR